MLGLSVSVLTCLKNFMRCAGVFLGPEARAGCGPAGKDVTECVRACLCVRKCKYVCVSVRVRECVHVSGVGGKARVHVGAIVCAWVRVCVCERVCECFWDRTRGRGVGLGASVCVCACVCACGWVLLGPEARAGCGLRI